MAHKFDGRILFDAEGKAVRVVGVLSSQVVPATPENLELIEVTEALVRFEWDDVGDALSWTVYRDAVSIGTTTSPTYLDSTVAPDTEYDYTVVATNSAGSSGISTPLTVTTDAIAAVPDAPTGLSLVQVTGANVLIQWNSVLDVAEWDVFRNGVYLADGTVEVAQYNDTTVVRGQTYNYQVLARNATGDSALCAALEVVMPANQVPVWNVVAQSAAVGAPFALNLNTLCSDGDGDPLSYSITSPGLPSGLALNANQISGTPLSAGSPTTGVRVTDGLVSVDAVLSFTITAAPDTTGPTAPVLGAAVIAGTSLMIPITTPSTDASGLFQYNIQRADNGGAFSFKFPVPPTATEFSEDNLPNGSYDYRVRAQDNSPAQNYGTYSNTITAVISAVSQAPGTPVNFALSVVSNTRIDASWSASSSGPTPDSYELQRSLTGSDAQNPLAAGWTNLTPAVSPFQNSGLTQGTTYFYRVRAIAGALASAYATSSATAQIASGTIYAAHGDGLDKTISIAWRTTEDSVAGRDWSSPPGAVPAALSGVFHFDSTTDPNANYPVNFPGNKIYKLNVDWRDVEPTRNTSRNSPGTYVFNSAAANLDKLQTLPAGWAGFQIDVRGAVATGTGVSAPAWLATGQADPNGWKYTGTISNGSGGASGNAFTYYNIGDSDWYVPFRLMLTAMTQYVIPGSGGKTYVTHPRWMTQIVHGSSASAGEEEGYGSPANNHVDTIQHLVDLVDAAVPDAQRRFAWVGECRPQLSNNAILAMGCGSRGGIIENFIRGEYTPAITDSSMGANGLTNIGQTVEQYRLTNGTQVSNSFYLTVDESFTALTALNGKVRHFADQNEFWKQSELGDPFPDKGHHPENWNLVYTLANERTVQMRRNVTAVEVKSAQLSNTGATAVNGSENLINPENSKWMSLNLGKRCDGVGGSTHVAHEAWIRLMQTWTRSVVHNESETLGDQSLRNIQIHNFEHFLKQREAWGATTVGSQKDYGWNPVAVGEKDAIEGNLATPSVFQQTLWRINRLRYMANATNGMGFKLDTRFLPGATANYPVAIKICHMADNSDTWTFEYRNAANQVQTKTHANASAGGIRTTTFFLTDFASIDANSTDFWLKGSVATGFMSIRVIRLDIT